MTTILHNMQQKKSWIRYPLSGQKNIQQVMVYIFFLAAGAGVTWATGRSWDIWFPIFTLSPLILLFILRDFRIGVALVLFIIPFDEFGDRGFILYKLLLQLFVLTVWMAGKFFAKEKLVNYLLHPLTPVIMLLTLLAGLGAVRAGNDRDYHLFISSMTGISSFFYYYIFHDLMQDKKNISWLLGALLSGAVVVVAIGLADFGYGRWITGNQYYRAAGTFSHANLMAKYLGLMVLLVASNLVLIKQTGQKWKWVLLGICFLLGIFFAVSRTTLIAMMAGLVFIVLIEKKPVWGKRYLTVLGVLIVILQLVFLGWLSQENKKYISGMGQEESAYLSQDDKDAMLSYYLFRDVKRKNYWITALELIKHRPVLGNGIGRRYQLTDRTYTVDDLKYITYVGKETGELLPLFMPHGHNGWLAVMTDMGVAGLLLLLWFYYRLIKTVNSTIKASMLPESKMMVMAAGSVIGFDMVVGLAEPSVMSTASQYNLVFTFITAFIFMNTTMRGKKNEKDSRDDT